MAPWMLRKKLTMLLLAGAASHVFAAYVEDEKKEKVTKDKHIVVHNYTLKHAEKSVDNNVDDFNELNEDIQDDLKTIQGRLKTQTMFICVVLSNHRELPKEQNNEEEKEGNVVLTDNTTLICKKYIVEASKGLMDSTLHRTIHKRLRYHIIQTKPSHIIPALCQFLHISKEKHVIYLALSEAICLKCHYLLQNVIGYRKPVKSHEKGCQGKDFTWPMPPLAMAYTNNFILASTKPLEHTEDILQQMIGVSTKNYQSKKDKIKELNKVITNRDNQIILLQNKLEENKEILKTQTQTISQQSQQITALKKQLKNQHDTLLTNEYLIQELKKDKANLQKDLNMITEEIHRSFGKKKTLPQIK